MLFQISKIAIIRRIEFLLADKLPGGTEQVAEFLAKERRNDGEKLNNCVL